jgi:FkbH-like protein
MTAVIDDFEPVYLRRITQLINKSNQFNLTTRRYTENEIENIYNSSDYIRLYGQLEDKFGDNGIVSVVIGRCNGELLNIDLWIMSCRVLKRDMEYAMLDELVAQCRKHGISRIIGTYLKTPKNSMVSQLYGTFGFELTEQHENGDSVWCLDVNSYVNKNKVIKIKEKSYGQK